MNGEITFRKAAFGGFNREDVMEYISSVATTNNEQQKLQQYENKASDFDNTADKLMRESMAYAERYVESANLMAGNIRKETVAKIKDADTKVDEMLTKAAAFSKECETLEEMLNSFKTQLAEIKKNFE